MTTKRDRVKKRHTDTDHDPELIFVERQFPVVLRRPLIWGMVIVLVALLPWSIATANAYSWQDISNYWLIFGVLFLMFYWAYHFIGWYFTVLILDELEITYVKQKGLFRREVQSLTLENVQSVNYTIPGFQGAMFKFGDVKISTLSGGGHMTIHTLSHPADIQAEILNAVQGSPSTGESGIVYDSGDTTEA